MVMHEDTLQGARVSNAQNDSKDGTLIAILGCLLYLQWN